jgi:glycosyltransferase involved in cell wall biosynthesis
VDHTPNSPRQKLSPILGLPIDDKPKVAPELHSAAVQVEDRPDISVIIPARNEEALLLECLASLLEQNGEFFRLGRDWELILVDDGSTDSTLGLMKDAAAGTEGVRVLEAPALELRDTQRAFTGKTQACWLGAQQARGRYLVFTDADTIHEPNSLIHALHEAKKYDASLLSYSPRQVVHGIWQHALMPLVFSELASVYPMAQVNDPASRTAAANGQFLMVEREAYFAVGGHRAVGRSILEDVDLAWNIKRSKRVLRFRYAPDALSTRMYRGFGDMVEGWTKNLALLFPHALMLAAWRMLDIALLLLPVLVFILPYLVGWQKLAIMLLWARNLWRFFSRVRRSNFGWGDCLISVVALPLFIVLLVRSWMVHRVFHQVAWKGRDYRAGR